MKFNVTYEVHDTEGEREDAGFVDEDMDLRDAVEELFRTRTSEVGGVESIEASCSDQNQARWITVQNGMEYLTGCYEARCLHFPDEMSGSSRQRLIDLLTGS